MPGGTSITLKEGTTGIASYAFSGCTSLASISIPNSVTTIREWAFSGCSSLTNINIPNSVTQIDWKTFYGCSSLTDINIPNTVTNIASSAFEGCSSLASISIPNSVTTIRECTFSGCSGLTNINIPNSVTTIYDEAFKDCSSLTDINIPNVVTNISSSVFSGCSSLTTINIPNSVTSIGDYAFHGCSSLTSISLPNSVTSIGEGAFSGCSSLTSINIPNSVTSIGGGAFGGTAWYNNQPDGLVYAGLVAYKYKGTMPEGTSITLKDGTIGIADVAFDSSGLTSINIPNSVTSIGRLAFCECYNLTSINIPNSVITIGSSAFWGCYRLIAVNIGNSVTTIGESAFENCTSLTNINIPNSVTHIDFSAFRDCTSLTNINFSNFVENIDEEAFYNCSSLNDIYCYSTTPPDCHDNSFSNYSATLHVPATSLATYFTAPVWSNFENIVGDAVEPTGITISRDSVEIQSGEQIELMATVSPANASCKEVIWYSTDTNVATVEDGVVTAVGYGECDIFAYCMGMPAVCHITVANRISLGQQEAMLLPNHMLTLTPSAPAMPAGFTVTSSDPTVAAARVMSGKVQIVGIKEGTTTITVASTDGTAQPATCLVTVYTESGDANCDGFVTIADVTGLIDYLLGSQSTSIKEANADLNGDGHITIADATTLIDQLLTTAN